VVIAHTPRLALWLSDKVYIVALVLLAQLAEAEHAAGDGGRLKLGKQRNGVDDVVDRVALHLWRRVVLFVIVIAQTSFRLSVRVHILVRRLQS
jgi:hypothetical protein